MKCPMVIANNSDVIKNVPWLNRHQLLGEFIYLTQCNLFKCYQENMFSNQGNNITALNIR